MPNSIKEFLLCLFKISSYNPANVYILSNLIVGALNAFHEMLSVSFLFLDKERTWLSYQKTCNKSIPEFHNLSDINWPALSWDRE